MHALKTNWLRLALVFAVLIGCGLSQTPAPSRVPARIVAIGDLHADIGVTKKAFRLAGAINEKDEWIGKSLTVVQLGDTIGRSDDERQVLDFLFAIRTKAEAGGGKVHVLIGNHEVMAGRIDNQAVGPNPFPGWVGIPGLNLNDPRLRILEPNERARGAALMPGGPYAKRLADFPAVLRIGGTVFAHGGVTPRWAKYGIDKINDEIRQWLLGRTPEPDSAAGVDDGDRVMWTRQFSSNVDPGDCEELEESLALLKVKRMIVAHTVHPKITPRCDNKVWAIDVGMSRAYGGSVEVLEILNDEKLSVLRP